MLNYVDVLLDTSSVGVEMNVTGSRDNAVFTLNPPIENCVGVSVITADVPFTYYVIDATNQWFGTTQCNNSNVPDMRFVRYRRLTPGTYSKSEFVSHFNQVGLSQGYNADGNDATQREGYHFGLKAFIDDTDGRIVIAMLNLINATPPTQLDYTTTTITDQNVAILLNSSGPYSGAPPGVYPVGNIAAGQPVAPQGTLLAKVLGFKEGPYTFPPTPGLYDNNDQALPSTIRARKGLTVVKLEGPEQMYLKSDLGSLMAGSVRNQTGNQSLIAFWPMNAQYQGTIEYYREEPITIPVTKSDILRVQVSLALGNQIKYGNNPTTLTDYLQLNGESFRIVLRFEVYTPDYVRSNDVAGNNVLTTSNPIVSYVKRRKATRSRQYIR
jgi:hypothetical protein